MIWPTITLLLQSCRLIAVQSCHVGLKCVNTKSSHSHHRDSLQTPSHSLLPLNQLKYKHIWSSFIKLSAHPNGLVQFNPWNLPEFMHLPPLLSQPWVIISKHCPSSTEGFSYIKTDLQYRAVVITPCWQMIRSTNGFFLPIKTFL